MPAAVLAYVFECLVQRVHDAYAEVMGHPFLAVVLIVESHASLHRSQQFGEVVHPVPVHQQAVQCVAHRHTPRLGIVHNALTHLQVTLLVEIGMNHPGPCLDDGHTGIVTHELDEPLTSARDTQVDVAHGIQHGCRSLVGGRQQRHDCGVDAFFLEHIMQETHDGPVAFIGILPSLQHAGVATLEAEAEHVKGDVGAGFIDHADDTEGYRDAAQVQPILQGALLGDAFQGRGQCCHMAHV